MRVHQWIDIAVGQCMVAGPTILVRIGDHRGAQGIEFDMAVAVHDVVATVDRTGLVATFPQCAAAVIPVIDVADIAPAKRLQRARDGVRLLRGQQQVHMVGHQHVGMHRTAFAQGGFAQQRAITEVVRLDEEAGLAAVAALQDMLRDVGKINAWRAGHWQACASGGRRFAIGMAGVDQTDARMAVERSRL